MIPSVKTEGLTGMSEVSLDVRFNDNKWSDKIEMVSVERSEPKFFSLKLRSYVESFSSTSETEIYRLQMLGEFVGAMMPNDRISDLRSALVEVQQENAARSAEGLKQFLFGLQIGEERRGDDALKRPEDYQPLYADPKTKSEILIS